MKTYDDEIVPDSEQFPHVHRAWLMLHGLSKECDEIGGAKVRTVH